MRIKANGITSNCAIDGPDGAPWIMFSNSLATNLSMWDPQVADFAQVPLLDAGTLAQGVGEPAVVFVDQDLTLAHAHSTGSCQLSASSSQPNQANSTRGAPPYGAALVWLTADS